MLQSYDPSKKNTNFLERITTTMHDSLAMALRDSFQTKLPIEILTSLALTHNNYVHLKGVKVLAVLLLQNLKEKACGCVG